MKRQKKHREIDELKSASEILHYELWQMIKLANPSTLDLAAKDLNLHNAVVESFLIHARALIHFLKPKGRTRLDNVLARQYFDSPEQWNRYLGRFPKILEKTRNDANFRLAHISYDRLNVKENEADWPYKEILMELWDVLIYKFIANVPKERLGQRCFGLYQIAIAGVKPEI